MTKKIIVLIIVVLFFIGGGFFWWWQGREIKGSPDDYVIRETPEGKIVENRKAKLTIKAPKEWETKKIEMKEGSVIFYPVEAEIELNGEKRLLPLKKGCMIETTVTHEKMNLTQIQIEARYTLALAGVKFGEFEEITIKNYPALKNTFDTEKSGPGMGIYIPRNDKVYWFYVFWSVDDKERCIQEFNKFLETVSIK